MAAITCRRATIDRLTLVGAIRAVLARSPIFHEASIWPPVTGPRGEVTVDVTFPDGATALRVTAPSDDEAYAILHELASTMVEIEQDRRVSSHT
jgi:hypothetical protein